MASKLKFVDERLPPEQRFRLVLAATGRGDMDDAARLVNSCPRRGYDQPDRDYVDRVAAASEMAHITTALLLSAMLAVQPHEIKRELFDDLRAQWDEMNAGHGAGDSPEWPLLNLRDACENRYREGVAGLLGICEGVKIFCTAISVEPAALFAMNPLALHYWRQASSYRSNIDHDRERADDVEKLLFEI